MTTIPFSRSVASHPKAGKYWSKSNVDENDNYIDPQNILKTSTDLYNFDCVKCKHTFEAKPCNVTHNTQPSWCQYCISHILCNKDDCIFCFNKSFLSSEYSKYIHPDCTVNPRNVFSGGDIVVTFICPKQDCKHIFEKNLRDVKHGYFCPYCPKSGKKKLCDDINCMICFKKSFASHEKSQFWSKKNNIDPRKVNIGSSTHKYWFDCPSCENEFEMSPCHISSNNKWCPYCKNKTELKMYTELQKYYPNIQTQFSADWCKNIRNICLPFDFLIEEYKIIIELDGDQHFIQVGSWSPPEVQRNRDLFKMKCANDNGYSIIRIYQRDVLNDKIEWVQILQESIQEIISKNIIENHFIAFDENKYKDFIF